MHEFNGFSAKFKALYHKEKNTVASKYSNE